ncbi:hypothetical protein DIPPA_09564 [Diplonema papillatum]|nr:hypothetical protein DIPPA_09564 [Diplonema papillatum]
MGCLMVTDKEQPTPDRSYFAMLATPDAKVLRKLPVQQVATDSPAVVFGANEELSLLPTTVVRVVSRDRDPKAKYSLVQAHGREGFVRNRYLKVVDRQAVKDRRRRALLAAWLIHKREAGGIACALVVAWLAPECVPCWLISSTGLTPKQPRAWRGRSSPCASPVGVYSTWGFRLPILPPDDTSSRASSSGSPPGRSLSSPKPSLTPPALTALNEPRFFASPPDESPESTARNLGGEPFPVLLPGATTSLLTCP